MPLISNENISVQVASKGAELQSIFHKQSRLEYIWGGDPAVWGKHSPVLFPIVGELKNRTYIHKGKSYRLSRHGFARDMDFEVTEQDNASVTFTLTSDAATENVYPFKFSFSVKYRLHKNSVQIFFIVENAGDEVMLFSVGGHPAFNVPLVEGTVYEDYQLVFSHNEKVGRWPISKDGLLELEPAPLLENENVLPLRKELFANDAIVLKDLKSKSVTISSSKTTHGITVHFDDFPYLGIWETKGGDFVCIEPWCGIADSVGVSGRLEEKEGINSLQPSATFEVSYTIEVF